MSTVLAFVVAGFFVWSIVLFVAAIVGREREQELGFGLAIASAALYVVTFSDHLPGGADQLRDVFEILPGVSASDARFSSAVQMIGVLAFIYVIRVIIFYQLFFSFDEFDFDGDGEPDDVNDLVAPFLSYVTFCVCLVTALHGLYDLSTFVTALLSALLLPLYYVPNLWRVLFPYLEVVYETARAAVLYVWSRAIDAVVLLVLAIGRAELRRRGIDTHSIDTRARGRRQATDDRNAANRERRHKALAKLAKAGRDRRDSQRRGAVRRAVRTTSNNNPNYR